MKLKLRATHPEPQWVCLPLISLVIEASLAQGLMKVSWIVMYYWLPKQDNEKKNKAIIYNEIKFNFFFYCNNKKYVHQNN